MPRAGRKLSPQDRLDHLERELPWLVKGRSGPAVYLDHWCGFTKHPSGQRAGRFYYALVIAANMGSRWRRPKPGRPFQKRIYVGRDPLVIETIKGWIKRRQRKLRSNNLAMAQLLGPYWRGVLVGRAVPLEEWNADRTRRRRAADDQARRATPAP
jgi:hypothetical protein